MKLKNLIQTILITPIFLLLPKLVFAGIADTIPIENQFRFVIFLIISIPLFKATVFCFLSYKLFKFRIRFLKILLVTILANTISLILFFSSVKFFVIGGLISIIIFAFILFVIIEWVTLYLIFFRKTNIRTFNLFKISFIVNLLALLFSFVVAAIYIG